MKIRIKPSIVRRFVKLVPQLQSPAQIYAVWSPIWPEPVRRAMEKRMGEISQ